MVLYVTARLRSPEPLLTHPYHRLIDWTSQVGYTDNTAHNNIDFLPWFLSQMKSKTAANGKRLLDYLDIHYYFQPDTSANDAAAKALRLRMTKSLWGALTTVCLSHVLHTDVCVRSLVCRRIMGWL